MDKEDRNFKERLKLGNDALFWINLANDCYFHLRNQLIVLATILLPLTASVVVIPKDSKSILIAQEKTLFIYGWLFLGISICLGLIQAWIDANFFRKLSNDSSLREHFRNSLSADQADNAVRLLPPVQSSSSHFPLFFQAIFLFGGILLIMSVAAGMLLRL